MSLFFRKRSFLQSQKLLRRERERYWVKVILFIVLFVILLWGLSTFSFISGLNIQKIEVIGNMAVSTDEILNVAKDVMSGRDLFIFSKTNILWYPNKKIVNELLKKYSWIDSAVVYKNSATSIVVKIKERVPVAVWCGQSQEREESCQLMDKGGFVFAPAPEFSGTAYLKLYGPAEFFLGTGLAHVLDLAKNLSEIGFMPASASFVDTKSYDIFLISGTRISVNVADAVSAIISNISSLLDQKTFIQSQTSNFSNLLYIDARFGNKLFFKFK